MHGQLYHRHTNATALSSTLVVSVLGSESDNPGSSPGKLFGKKKVQAPLLGLAKSIYYLSFGQVFFQEGKRENV